MTRESRTLDVGGVPRRYVLAHPGPAAGRRPLVVFLHGTGGSAEWADDETGWTRLAAAEGLAVALPDGLPPDPAQPPRFFTNPRRWNDGSPAPDTLPPAAADDVGFLAAVIADAVAVGAADRRRVCLTGFSNGAGMAFRLAAERADLVAAVAPVAGHCWQADPRPTRPVPTLYLVGDADPLVPLAGGPVSLPWGGRPVVKPAVAATLARWAEAVGCHPHPPAAADADGVREVTYRPRPGGAELTAVTVGGLGHHWPGGKGQLNPRFGGRPSGRVDGCRRVWQFASRYAAD